MWDWVLSFELQSKSYKDGLIEIAESLKEGFKGYSFEIVNYMKNVEESVKIWVNALEKVM
jgi:hypothetical protein